MSTTTTRRRSTAAVGLVALGSHALYSVLAAPTLLPISDAQGYRLLGKHLAEGHGYIRPYDFINGSVRPTAEFPPGFPGLLAVLHLVGIRSVEAQRFALAGLHALVAVLVVHIARRWWSDRVAVMLGVVTAVHPALIQPGAAMLAESLFVLAAALVLLLAIRLVEMPSPRNAAVLGLAGGAAMLVRSEGLVLAGLLVLPVLVMPMLSFRGRVRVGTAFAIGLLLLPGAWAVRNATTFDEPVLSSNNIGSVLSGANCDQAYFGDLAGFWLVSDDCFAGFRDADLATADESVVADALREDGLSYARTHAREIPRVATVRVLRTFQLWEPEQQARLATFEGRRLLTERITGWITWCTLALGLVGTVGLVRRRRLVQLWMLASPVLIVVVLAAATYGNPRFRVVAEIPMLLLAAEGVRLLVDVARSQLAPTAGVPVSDQPASAVELGR